MSENESSVIHASERAAADTRQARVDRLNAMVLEIFPGDERRELRENIERSFAVPQVGEYHNEGGFMDSHLDLIIQNIEAVARQTFPSEVTPTIREILIRAVRRDVESVKKYVFLHDISKADCMTLKRGDEEQAVTWNEWQYLLMDSPNGRKALADDEQGLRDFCAEQGITGISYFQKTESGARKHGEMGAGELRAAGIEADAAMLAAIEAHEVAYQFEAINVRTYEDHFKDLSSDARDFALLGSYVDTMASLRPDGKPDLANFLALAGSREKFDALRTLEARLADAKLDKQKFQRAWAALRNSVDPLTDETLDEAEAKLRADCKIAGYDIEKLRAAVEPLVSNGTLTADERDRLLVMAETDPQGIGRQFAPKMRLLGPTLNASKT